jgi:hypothetical protein
MMTNQVTSHYPAREAVDLAAWLGQEVGKLTPGGILSVQALIVPGSRLRGKKADVLREAGRYVNAFLQMSGLGHDPKLLQVRRYYSQHEWQDAFHRAGLVVESESVMVVRHTFHDTAVHLADKDRLRLRALLTQAPAPVLDYLTPQFAGDRITFHLHELLIMGKSSNSVIG